MARFKINADVQVKVWQHCVFQVEADSLEETKQKIKNNPQTTCVNYETLDSTEEVIHIDLEGENFSSEIIKQ